MANPLGSTPGIIVGVGVGGAAAAALEPAIEQPRQQAWAKKKQKILDVGLLARLVAQGAMELDQATTEAGLDGYDTDKLAALTYLAQTVPPVAEALTLWRRGLISDALFDHVLVKNGLDQRYVPGLQKLKTSEPLPPAVVANAIVRGIVKAPFPLPVEPPTTTGNVPAFPTSAIDAANEAAQSGMDTDRLFVETAIAGRPMSPEAAAVAYFKGLLELVDYQRAISEGDVRNEWSDAILENQRPITSPVTAAGLRLRGWKTQAEALAYGEKHGADAEFMDNLYLDRGRPATPRQIHLGYARGASYVGETLTEDQAIARGVLQSDIRPEWEAIEAQNVWTYPSPFVLRQLTQSGAFTEAQTEQILLESGWKQEYATAAAQFWAGGPAGKTIEETRSELADEFTYGFIGEPEYRSALTSLGLTGHQQDLEVLHSEVAAIKTERARAVTGIHSKFVKGTIDEAAAQTALQQLGMQADAITRAIDYWTVEADA